MKRSNLVLVLLLLLYSRALPQGFIIPVPPHPGEPPLPYLGMRYHHVEIKIDNQVAKTSVDQVFKNDSPRELEGDYIFPLPVDASVSKFSMYVGGEELKGEILDKNQARNIYEGIVRRRKDPALLEYYNQGMFRARVYPIPAFGETRIKLGYSQILKSENGICEYKYSLSTGKFSQNPLESVKIELVLNSAVQIKNVYSPTHDIKVNRENDHRVKVFYLEEKSRPDKDFILYYSLSEKEIGFDLLCYQDHREGNFFMALFSPKMQKPEIAIRKKVIFILDTSGSMQGDKIRQAKDALTFCLNGLNPQDSFNLIDFDDQIKPFREKLIAATGENIDAGTKFIQDCEADGGTDINSALLEGLRQLNHEEKATYIIFLTDGQPTVGITDNARILQNMKEKNGSARIFVFGVGFDVNTHFLDRLAKDHHAASDYVTPNEDIELKVSSFFKKISNPILSNLTLKFSGIKTFDLYPNELTDLFSGSQMIILGKYRDEGSSTTSLTGYTDKTKHNYSFPVKFIAQGKNDFIPRLWATRRIAHLEDQIRFNGMSQELIDEIVRLSKRYGIITEYTSFLVDADRPLASGQPGAPGSISDALRSQVGFVVRNQELHVRGGRAGDVTYMFQDSGSHAVYQSKNSASLQKAQVAPDRFIDFSGKEKKISGIVQIGNKTFFKSNELWYDSQCDTTLKTVKIKRFSTAYFELAKRFPEFEKYLSLGERVIFVHKDKMIEISELGEEKIEILNEL